MTHFSASSPTPSPSRRVRGLPRLPQRWAGILMPLILSVLMTLVVSAISTVRSVGLVPDLPSLWLGAWGLSWMVAFPVLLVVLPLVRRIVGLLVQPAA